MARPESAAGMLVPLSPILDIRNEAFHRPSASAMARPGSRAIGKWVSALRVMRPAVPTGLESPVPRYGAGPAVLTRPNGAAASTTDLMASAATHQEYGSVGVKGD
jgi:hypothetical protein